MSEVSAKLDAILAEVEKLKVDVAALGDVTALATENAQLHQDLLAAAAQNDTDAATIDTLTARVNESDAAMAELGAKADAISAGLGEIDTAVPDAPPPAE